MSKPLTFVLNDETKVNCYNFRVKNSGIDLVRLLLNPVMLAEHIPGVWTVIGRWENIRIEGAQLLGEAVFDVDDEEAKKIAGKVTRGFLKGCSLGLYFEAKDMVLAPDGAFDLIKCEAIEVSIVAIPGLAAAVKLYASDGKLLNAEQINLSLSLLPTKSNTDNKQVQNMEKFTLTAAAIVALAAAGITATDDPTAINAAIERMGTQLSAEKSDHNATKVALKAMTEVQVKRDVDSAILSGRIVEAQRETFMKLGASDHGLLSETLAAMPAKTTLGGKVVSSESAGDDPKTLDEFEKLPLEKQLAFKTENKEGYAKLFA